MSPLFTSMSELGSTSLDSLPSSAARNKPSSNNKEMDTDGFLADLKDASSAGLTSLPTRDIPTDSSQQVDPGVIQNKIPEPTRRNYIEEETDAQEIIQSKCSRDKKSAYYTDLITEYYVPLLASLLYFLSQLPTTRAFIAKNLPFCYHSQGEMTIQGMATTSLLFGLSLVGLNYAVDNFI